MIFTVHHAKDLVNTIDMLENVTEDDLVLFSLDNVIIEPLQMYGSPEHYAELLRILPYHDASSIFWKAQKDTEIRLPEDDIKKQLDILTARGIVVMGITARTHYALNSTTTSQLNKLGIAFSNNHLNVSSGGVHMSNGILYTNDSNKFDCIKLLQKETDFIPRRLIFVAASVTALEEFGALVEEQNINYLGISYDYLNWKIKNFDIAVADLQREHHEERGVIMSDRDAMRLLARRIS